MSVGGSIIAVRAMTAALRKGQPVFVVHVLSSQGLHCISSHMAPSMETHHILTAKHFSLYRGNKLTLDPSYLLLSIKVGVKGIQPFGRSTTGRMTKG